MTHEPQLRSQRLRMVNHQGDALRLGMNWTEEDLGKPQILVDSAYGMGHPGTFHFRELIEEVSNGVYEAGNAPNSLTSDHMWPMGADVERGELSRQDLEIAQRGACPTCGACQFMGSARTGQVMAEALGLALPGSALVPAPLTKLLRYARATGKAAVDLVQANLTARRILTREAFENAIILHAATGGSTNALLHLPVIAREAGVDITIDDFDRIHRRVPVLANVKTTGRYPVEDFWYAGGVPAVMLELRDMLHQNCLTVTGKTVGENLDEIAASPVYFAERRGYLNNVKVKKDEIVRPRSDPFGTDGGVAVLYGNLAPSGAMIKTFSVPKEMHVHTGPARVFDFEDEAVHALIDRKITPGDVLVIRYEGPRANGMPEMYYAAAILSADRVLNTTTAIVTDGRYSGAMQGPCIGHVAPEAIDSGPIALVAEGDLIEINAPARRLAMVGVNGEHRSDEEIEAILADRRSVWKPPRLQHAHGILSLYSRVAREASEGASIT
jgi:dihydroxy-acid dehydratase